MYIDGDVLELDIEMDLEEVKALEQFAKERLQYIEEIVLLVSKEGHPLSSALFTLLFWIKRQKPSIKIEAIDSKQLNLESYGTMYWVKT
jgi:formyltetrahydrofolate hydrolase